MKVEYTLGDIVYNSSRERDEQRVKVTVHCRYGPFNYMLWVHPQVAQNEQGREMITEWGMEAWRDAYEKKRQDERLKRKSNQDS